MIRDTFYGMLQKPSSLVDGTCIPGQVLQFKIQCKEQYHPVDIFPLEAPFLSPIRTGHFVGSVLCLGHPVSTMKAEREREIFNEVWRC